MAETLNKIKNLLKKEIGLDTSTIGETTVSNILHNRMKACKLTEIDDYYAYLNSHQNELHKLLEESVIPETWFFRDDKPFKVIFEDISKNLKKNSKKIHNILTIPCSTGEEPYSLSMYLDHMGIDSSSYNIHAVDISQTSINIARQAQYNQYSFRGETAKIYCHKYFTKHKTDFLLNSKIKASVEFHQLNILKTSSLYLLKFDFILCRNLLIYFDKKTKDIAYRNLNKLLNPEGVIFLGHSEFGSVPEVVFEVTNINNVFCLKKKGKAGIGKSTQSSSNIIRPAVKPTVLKPIKSVEKKPFSDITNLKKTALDIKNIAKEKSIDSEQTLKIKLLKDARTLADSGRLSEAETVCLEYIDSYGDHEESFFLLGLISETSNNNEMARKFYKKSLYLNPKHYETLIHLSLITESYGQNEASQRLKDRAQRVLKE